MNFVEVFINNSYKIMLGNALTQRGKDIQMSTLKENLKSAAIGGIVGTGISAGVATTIEGIDSAINGQSTEAGAFLLSTLAITFLTRVASKAIGKNMEEGNVAPYLGGAALAFVAAFNLANHYNFLETVSMTKQDNSPVVEQQKPAESFLTGASVHNGVVIPAGLKIG